MHAVLVRFSKYPDIPRDLIHLEEDLREDGVKIDPLAYVRMAVWGMMYADDTGVVYKSAKGLAKVMTVIVTFFEAADLTVSKKKTENILHRTGHLRPHRSSSKQRDRGIDRRCSFCV